MSGVWYINNSNEYLNVISIDRKVAEKNKYGEPVSVNGKKCYKYTFALKYTYKTKTAQKKYINRVIKVKNSLSGSDKNKVKQFDTYMRKNCKYDDSKEKYSAYHALVDGKSVCNGYAEAAAAVLDLAGVKVEFVTGPANGSKDWEGHAWNIVKIGSKWYSCDFCWDSCINKTTYLLKGTKNKKFWKEHKLDKQYKTKAWKKAHPMAAGDL